MSRKVLVVPYNEQGMESYSYNYFVSEDIFLHKLSQEEYEVFFDFAPRLENEFDIIIDPAEEAELGYDKCERCIEILEPIAERIPNVIFALKEAIRCKTLIGFVF